MEIGTRLKILREMKGYSQEYMADKLGISSNGYGKIERNQSNLSFLRLEQIAEILELSPSDILAFDEKMIFQNCNTFALINNGTINNIEKEIYLKKIEFLESKVSELEKLLEHYKYLIDIKK